MKLIFSGTSNPELAKKIASLLDTELQPLTIEKFKDGEILPRFDRSIRNQEIYLVQSGNSSDSIIETILILDAAKRCGAKVNLICSYYPYSRQDKVDHIRSSIGSAAMARMFETFDLNRIICVDLHNSAIQGFFSKAEVVHLNGGKIFVDYFKKMNLQDVTILSPDQGGMVRATQFAKFFDNCQIAVINKKRVRPNEVHSMELVGNVKDRNVIIIDDMCDTAGTLKKAADLIHENGAKSIYAVATHGLFSGNAIENIETSHLTKMVVSDSINLQNKRSPKIDVISCSGLIASCIDRLDKKISIDELNKV